MPAALENGFFGGGVPAWHGLGTTIDEDVLTAAGVIEIVPELGYDVEMIPAYVKFDGRQLPTGRFATVRADGKVLGDGLSKHYEVIQNADAFGFVDAIVDSGEAKYHTAGTLKDGRVAWMLAKLGKDIVVGGMEDERIEQFLLCSNSFDGSASLIATLTRVRVVCQNTLSMALGSAAKDRQVRIRHVTGIDGRVAEARRVLDIAFASSAEFEAVANELVSQKMTSKQFTTFLENLVPASPNGKPVKNAAAIQETIAAIYSQATNLDNVRGTKWAAYNAVAEYFDHHARQRASSVDETDREDSRMENRMLRVTSDFRLKDQALALLTK